MRASRVLIVLSFAVLHWPAVAADSGWAICTNSALRPIVQRVVDADYRGDLATLKSADAELAQWESDRSCSARAGYWRAFAGWRFAINASNKEAATRQEIARLLEAAASTLRSVLLKQPEDVEAKVALLGIVQMTSIFLERGSVEQRAVTKEGVDLSAVLAKTAPDNPRYLWLRGGTHFWAPAPFGEGPDAALSIYFRGIAFANTQTPSENVIEPTWGLPELIMSVAYVSAHREKPDLKTASQFAMAALRLRPDWSYVRDILMPDIARRSAGTPR